MAVKKRKKPVKKLLPRALINRIIDEHGRIFAPITQADLDAFAATLK